MEAHTVLFPVLRSSLCCESFMWPEAAAAVHPFHCCVVIQECIYSNQLVLQLKGIWALCYMAITGTRLGSSLLGLTFQRLYPTTPQITSVKSQWPFSAACDTTDC